ncbi:YceD family protein [Sphingomonas aestuarii]
MNVAPEFSRLVRLDRIGAGASAHDLTADEAERVALAARFGLIAIDRLDATVSLSREGDDVIATGRLSAAVVQRCIASDEPVPAAIDTDLAIRFVPERDDPAEEVELDTQALDTVDYRGGAIDLGEAAAETLALALDPFPRSPQAEAALKAAGVLSEDEAKLASSPFAALKGLGTG